MDSISFISELVLNTSKWNGIFSNAVFNNPGFFGVINLSHAKSKIQKSFSNFCEDKSSKGSNISFAFVIYQYIVTFIILSINIADL